MTKLAGGQPAIRQSSAEALAELADLALVRRLQALVEDERTDSALRQIALWALGHSGQKAAVVVLLDQLSNPEEMLRQSAADALAELTGLAYGIDVAGWRGWWKQHQDMSNEALARRAPGLQNQSSTAVRGRARTIEIANCFAPPTAL